MNNECVGVIVARFQVSDLHDGHRYLLDEVCRRHRDVLVVLGSARTRATKKDPLNFAAREAMVKEHNATVRVRPLEDCRYDDIWSRNLDRLIAEEFPERTAVLYGSRDSFISYYTGANRTVEIEAIEAPSGTELRKNGDGNDYRSKQFRAGLIAAQDRLPSVYPTIDVAIVHREKRLVLLGGRNDESQLRFIGGFVDPTDRCLKATVKREVSEEAGDIEIDDLRYLCSTIVDDWRYRETDDRIMANFFIATYVFGRATPGDDIDRLQWVPYEEVPSSVVSEHKPFATVLTNHLTREDRKETNHE